MSRSVKAHLLLVFITFVWGCTFVLVKDALADCTPMLMNAVRFVLSALLLAAVFYRELPRITRGALWAGFQMGSLLWLGYEFQTTGLKLTSASKSAFITGLSVVLVPLLLGLFWRRHINRWTLGGVAVAFVGLYMMTVPPGAFLQAAGSINRGDLLTMGCSVSFALQIIVVGRSAQRYPFMQLVVIEVAVAAAWMVLTVPLAERGAYLHPTHTVLAAIIICALLSTVLGFAVQVWAQQFTPPTHTALIFALEPVFAALTSYVLLSEVLGWRGGLGAVLILGGVLVSELLGTVQQPEAELREEAA